MSLGRIPAPGRLTGSYWPSISGLPQGLPQLHEISGYCPEVIVKALGILSVAYYALSVLDAMHKDWLTTCQKEKRGKLAELLGELAIACFCSSSLDDGLSDSI